MHDLDGWMAEYAVAMERADPAHALTCLEAALALDAKFVPALGCKATMLSGQGRHIEALDCLDRIVEVAPSLAMAHYSRGLQLTAVGRVTEAIDAYSTAIRVDPKERDSFVNRGRLLDDSGDPAAAISDYDAALAIDQGEVIAWANRGNSLSSLERFDDAIESFERALSLDLGHAPAMLGKSHALMSLGRIAEANSARPRGTPLDQGDAVELGRELPNGDTLVLRYYPASHSHPALLEEKGRGLLEHCASLFHRPPGLDGGVRIAYGWTLLTVRQKGTVKVLCEPDFPRHPMSQLRYDVTFSLQALVMQQLTHSVVGLAPCACHCLDGIAVTSAALEQRELHLRRVSETQDGFSGWVAGPRTTEEIDEMLDAGALRMIPTALLGRVRPHLIKVLTLPPGCVVVFDRHAVVSVIDPSGSERFHENS